MAPTKRHPDSDHHPRNVDMICTTCGMGPFWIGGDGHYVEHLAYYTGQPKRCPGSGTEPRTPEPPPPAKPPTFPPVAPDDRPPVGWSESGPP